MAPVEIGLPLSDRNNFLDWLGKVLSETGTKCFAWALIPYRFGYSWRFIEISECQSEISMKKDNGEKLINIKRNGKGIYIFSQAV